MEQCTKRVNYIRSGRTYRKGGQPPNGCTDVSEPCPFFQRANSWVRLLKRVRRSEYRLGAVFYKASPGGPVCRNLGDMDAVKLELDAAHHVFRKSGAPPHSLTWSR